MQVCFVLCLFLCLLTIVTASVKEPPPTSMPIKAHNLPAAFIKRHADNDSLFQNEFDVSVAHLNDFSMSTSTFTAFRLHLRPVGQTVLYAGYIHVINLRIHQCFYTVIIESYCTVTHLLRLLLPPLLLQLFLVLLEERAIVKPKGSCMEHKYMPKCE